VLSAAGVLGAALSAGLAASSWETFGSTGGVAGAGREGAATAGGSAATDSSFLPQAVSATVSSAATSSDLFMVIPFFQGDLAVRPDFGRNETLVSALPSGKRLFMMQCFRKT
jgi:hypothetical protein